MSLIKRIVLLGTIAVLSISTYAQTDVSRAEALFIYNFSRLIEWPANYKTGPFIIGVLGNYPIYNQLKTYTTGKQVGSQPINVKLFNTPNEIGSCHILFIPFPETKTMPNILPKVATKSTLIISEKNGAIEQGAGINFVVVGNKLKFEYSPANVAKYNIKVSSKLSEMAYKVY